MSMLEQLKNRSASTGTARPAAVKAPASIKPAVSAPSPAAALVRKAQAPRMAAPSSNNRQLVKPKQQQTTNAGAMARRQGTSVARQNDYRYDNEYYDDESDDSEEEEEEYYQPRNKRSQRRLGSDRGKGESKGFTFVNNGFMGAPGTTMTDLGNDYKGASVLKGDITNHYNVASPPSTEPSLSQAFSNF